MRKKSAKNIGNQSGKGNSDVKAGQPRGSRPKTSPPSWMVPDTKDKNLATNPNNQANENGVVQFTRSSGNPIRVGSHRKRPLLNELAIQTPPGQPLKPGTGSAPALLDKADDILLDAICTLINSKSGLNLSDPANLVRLHSVFPITLGERELNQLVFETSQPTRRQREDTYRRVKRLSVTPYKHKWTDQANAYNQTRGLGLSQSDLETIGVEYEGNILAVDIQTIKLGGRGSSRSYILYRPPCFLDQALLTRQVKFIPRDDPRDRAYSLNDNARIVKMQLGKLVCEAHSLISHGQSASLGNRHFCVRLERFYRDNGIEFNGKSPQSRRVQRCRLVRTVRSMLDDMMRSFGSLAGYRLLPEENGLPKSELRLAYRDLDGSLITKGDAFCDGFC